MKELLEVWFKLSWMHSNFWDWDIGVDYKDIWLHDSYALNEY
jgi:hypothetical protein